MRRLEERELRSLERKSMYSIFAPLDADERLPRELILEARRYRALGRRELAGILWLPSLFLVLTVAGWRELSVLTVLGLVVMTFVGFAIFAMTDDRNRRPFDPQTTEGV
jgi:uncharacterized membrane protein YhaH (DUF805 family)